MFIFHEMNSVCETEVLPHVLYTLSPFMAISAQLWTVKSEVYTLGIYKILPELGQQEHFPQNNVATCPSLFL